MVRECSFLVPVLMLVLLLSPSAVVATAAGASFLPPRSNLSSSSSGPGLFLGSGIYAAETLPRHAETRVGDGFILI